MVVEKRSIRKATFEQPITFDFITLRDALSTNIGRLAAGNEKGNTTNRKVNVVRGDGRSTIFIRFIAENQQARDNNQFHGMETNMWPLEMGIILESLRKNGQAGLYDYFYTTLFYTELAIRKSDHLNLGNPDPVANLIFPTFKELSLKELQARNISEFEYLMTFADKRKSGRSKREDVQERLRLEKLERPSWKAGKQSITPLPAILINVDALAKQLIVERGQVLKCGRLRGEKGMCIQLQHGKEQLYLSFYAEDVDDFMRRSREDQSQIFHFNRLETNCTPFALQTLLSMSLLSLPSRDVFDELYASLKGSAFEIRYPSEQDIKRFHAIRQAGSLKRAGLVEDYYRQAHILFQMHSLPSLQIAKYPEELIDACEDYNLSENYYASFELQQLSQVRDALAVNTKRFSRVLTFDVEGVRKKHQPRSADRFEALSSMSVRKQKVFFFGYGNGQNVEEFIERYGVIPYGVEMDAQRVARAKASIEESAASSHHLQLGTLHEVRGSIKETFPLVTAFLFFDDQHTERTVNQLTQLVDPKKGELLITCSDRMWLYQREQRLESGMVDRLEKQFRTVKTGDFQEDAMHRYAVLFSHNAFELGEAVTSKPPVLQALHSLTMLPFTLVKRMKEGKTEYDAVCEVGVGEKAAMSAFEITSRTKVPVASVYYRDDQGKEHRLLMVENVLDRKVMQHIFTQKANVDMAMSERVMRQGRENDLQLNKNMETSRGFG